MEKKLEDEMATSGIQKYVASGDVLPIMRFFPV